MRHSKECCVAASERVRDGRGRLPWHDARGCSFEAGAVVINGKRDVGMEEATLEKECTLLRNFLIFSLYVTNGKVEGWNCVSIFS